MSVMVKVRKLEMRREEKRNRVTTEEKEGIVKMGKRDIATIQRKRSIATAKMTVNGVVMTMMIPGLTIEMVAPAVNIEIKQIKPAVAEIVRDGIAVTQIMKMILVVLQSIILRHYTYFQPSLLLPLHLCVYVSLHVHRRGNDFSVGEAKIEQFFGWGSKNW